MNYKNGSLQIAIMQDGGKDEFNRPKPAIITWTDPIRCHIETVTHRNDAIVTDGISTQSSYMIWFGTYTLNNDVMQIFEEYNRDRIECIRLVHNKLDIGDWQVQNIEVKNMFGRVEIMVGNRINRQV